jgi:hypothetical protein
MEEGRVNQPGEQSNPAMKGSSRIRGIVFGRKQPTVEQVPVEKGR